MIFSPLEQFNIITLLPLHIGNYYFSFTNSSLFMALATGLFLLLFSFVTVQGGHLVPTRWQSIIEMIYEFIANLITDQVGEQGKKYFPVIFTLFTFLLCSNLIGMIPYSFTTTSHAIVTFSLSFTVFFAATIIGFQTHGIHFFSFLLPPGAPLMLAPFLVVLELVSYCFRGISLGVRLFANMMAGHTLLKVIAGFAYTLMGLGGLLFFLHFFPLIILIPLFALEFGVALIQTFVFTILVCIYINDAMNLH